MTRELIIDESCGYTRAALIEDGKLVELHGEKIGAGDETESLFLGRVQSIRTSLHAAFVDIGTQLHAFLPLGEQSTFRCGDMIIVQGAAKQASDTKGLRITEKINLAGKWLVLLPGETGVHVSKKVKDTALRQALMEVGREICPQDCGMIIRTASEEVTAQLLEEEARQLYASWQDIQQKARGMTKPGLLHERMPLPMRLARDLRELHRIVVNSEDLYTALIHAQEEKQIAGDTRIELYMQHSSLLFDVLNIESQIDKALRKRVWLPCGGYLIIDFTEALTVIDVNSGKMVLGRDLEETALRMNLEAADEIARQLRLRDIGGIIIVDFIDMRSDEHRQALMQRMREAVSQDRSQVSVEGLTRLGLMEMSRKRVHAQLSKALCVSCSYCSGAGMVLSGEETARRAMRQIKRLIAAGQRGPFVVRCAPSAAQALAVMCAPKEAMVHVLAVHGRHSEKYDIEQIGAGMPPPRDAQALKQED